jgi:RES domain-containing protein
MITVWRIASETPCYAADDISGTGASLEGGRWNRNGSAVLYCTSSIALACLETLSRAGEQIPANRYLVQIDIPEDIWYEADRFPADTIPIGWDAVPPGKTSHDFGEHWIAEGRSAILVVPSVIAPEECNILINPYHVDWQRIRSRKIRKWVYDFRLLRLLFT